MCFLLLYNCVFPLLSLQPYSVGSALSRLLLASVYIFTFDEDHSKIYCLYRITAFLAICYRTYDSTVGHGRRPTESTPADFPSAFLSPALHFSILKISNEFKVIGAGLPRTGTASLQAALEILGFGPTYHMFEIFKDVQKGKDWLAAFEAHRRGEQVDWKQLVKGYRSGIDAPVSDVFVDMARADPDLKVILTHRPAEEWIRSVNNTIAHILKPFFGFMIYWVPECYWQRQLCVKGIVPYWRRTYGVPGLCKELMGRRIEEVKREIPAGRLLIYRVQEGWEPLCKFLDVPIPSVPFPCVNDAESMGKFMKAKVQKGMLRWLMVLTGVVGLASVLIPQLQKLTA